MNSIIIIPARLGSTRLPNKMLLARTGKPLIQHTWESAQASRKASRVIVATDDLQMKDVVEGFGGEAVMTRADHVSGTDRIAEVAQQLEEFDVVVNLQGDEPEIEASSIDLAIELLSSDPELTMSTLATPIRDRNLLLDTSCVKVVVDASSRALYFSRAAIPNADYCRDGKTIEDLLARTPATFLQHIGLYAYRRDFLLQIPGMPRTDHEICESLEQLRVIDAGYSIAVGMIEAATPGIDTPADYEAFVMRHSNC